MPLLNPEEYGDQQPLVISSIFQKSLKQKVRVDRLEGTYEKDPEFINFVAASEAPMIKLLSAEQQLEEIEKAAAGKTVFPTLSLYFVTFPVFASSRRGAEGCHEPEK